MPNKHTQANRDNYNAKRRTAREAAKEAQAAAHQAHIDAMRKSGIEIEHIPEYIETVVPLGPPPEADKPKKSKGPRTRNFATVVYPESAPADWGNILSEHKIPAFISPLHDADINPMEPNDLGLVEPKAKKAHYHVIIMFEGPKTHEQAEEIFKTIGGVGLESVNSLRGYARYLCHLDDPDKAQYSPEEVICMHGADYHAVIGLETDIPKAYGEMMDYCESHKQYSYMRLLKHAKEHRPDWYRVLCKRGGAAFMDRYLKSLKWTMEEEEREAHAQYQAELQQLERNTYDEWMACWKAHKDGLIAAHLAAREGATQ